jgi:hypothetical protein
MVYPISTLKTQLLVQLFGIYLIEVFVRHSIRELLPTTGLNYTDREVVKQYKNEKEARFHA